MTKAVRNLNNQIIELNKMQSEDRKLLGVILFFYIETRKRN